MTGRYTSVRKPPAARPTRCIMSASASAVTIVSGTCSTV